MSTPINSALQSDTTDLSLKPGSAIALLLAAAACCAASGLYFYQSMLAQLARELAIPDSRIGVIPTATMIGYALGILVLAPLGDRLRLKRVLILKLALLAFTMIGAASASNWTALALWSFLVGVWCTAAQDALALAAQLTTPALRARVVATATSGILLGVLIGRLMGGVLADLWGWRVAFVAGGLVTALIVLPLALRVPQRPPSTQLTYGALLGSLIRLWRAYPALRAAVLGQCALFGAYGMFWAMVAPMMATRFGWDAGMVALLAIPAAIGVFAMPFVARGVARYGVRPMVRWGIAIVVSAFVLFAIPAGGVAAIITGIVVLDIGLRFGLAATQAVIYALEPTAQARINTIFVSALFAAQALGAFVASLTWLHGGWIGLCIAAMTVTLLAMVPHRAAKLG